MNFPLSSDLQQQLESLDSTQSAFVAGFLWARSQGSVFAETTVGVANNPVVSEAVSRKITVLSASQTGNALGVAKQLLAALQAQSLDATLVSAGDYKARQLSKEDIILLVASTQGEGEPPEEGVLLHKFLTSKKAPRLDSVSFAVFGLGDSSYPDFCQAGKDFDARLGDLGATRLAQRIDADLDYQEQAIEWVERITQTVLALAVPATIAPEVAVSTASAPSAYNKNTPYKAELLQQHALVDITAGKNTAHVEIDLGESELSYQAGDALGVISHNNATVVAEVLALSGLLADAVVEGRSGQTTLAAALTDEYDLNQLTPQLLAQYRDWLGDKLATELEQVNVEQMNLASLLHDFPVQNLSAQALIDGLKPLTPRLYSIASSQAEVGGEVHLCVGEVAFVHHDTDYQGSASGLLTRLEEGDELSVFVEPNPRFRLPENPDTPIIMIGAGTGIAPYRGFMQQRVADDASGKNWLFFGNRHYRKDFLYQAEWLRYRDSGALHQVDLAWSRGGEKVYVQDKIREQAQTVWQWLQSGAHVYVCGDAKRMAKDVEIALLAVISEQGGLDDNDAEAYLDRLREEKRYQRDVY